MYICILDLTGNQDGLALIRDYPQILISLLMLTQDNTATIAKDACLALVNISANEKGATALLNLKIEMENMSVMLKPPDNIVLTSLKFVMDRSRFFFSRSGLHDFVQPVTAFCTYG